jgi:hypothetical protein
VLDKEANNSKVQYLHGRHGRICGRYKCEGDCVLPGETSEFVWDYCHREVMRRIQRSQQRPYKVVRPTTKGPNLKLRSRDFACGSERRHSKDS